MTAMADVRAALALFAEPQSAGDRHVITTQYLYPSNTFVAVYISKAGGGAIVSDGGGALDCASAHGLTLPEHKRAFAILQQYPGLKNDHGEIRTGRLSRDPDHLLNGVVTVARAAARVAEYWLTEFRPRIRRNLESAIFTELQRHVSVARIHRNRKLLGGSNRQYTFDFSVPLGRRGMLLVDAVEPEAASLLAKFASHMDIAKAGGTKVEHRIVYDDQEEWKAEDLALLQMAATLVPLSKLNREIRGLAG